jgi:hypothetical protein
LSSGEGIERVVVIRPPRRPVPEAFELLPSSIETAITLPVEIAREPVGTSSRGIAKNSFEPVVGPMQGVGSVRPIIDGEKRATLNNGSP